MIHELRTYTLKAGTQAAYLKLSGEVGRKIRGDRYGKLEGYWYTEFGTINQLVHLWGFADLNERDRLRAALAKDEAWNKEYIPQIRPMMLAQENKILQPAVPLQPPADTGNVYELRWYRTHVGQAAESIEIFKGILPTREKFMRRVGVWQTQVGQLNEQLACRQRPLGPAGYRPPAGSGNGDEPLLEQGLSVRCRCAAAAGCRSPCRFRAPRAPR